MRQARTFSELYEQIMARKGVFFGAFFVVMVFSYGFLFVIDFVPEPVTEESTNSTVTEPVEEEEEEAEEMREDVAPLPESIYFDSLDRLVTVQNPVSDSIEVLDEALLKGAVRHPQSADFRDEGNMFILGHSSYLPTVFNKNFQAFNEIQKLAWGDIVRVRSEDREYVYRVERVYEAKASEVVVPNSRGEAKLTLATCNTFGAKEDRFIVEASLVSSSAR